MEAEIVLLWVLYCGKVGVIFSSFRLGRLYMQTIYDSKMVTQQTDHQLQV